MTAMLRRIRNLPIVSHMLQAKQIPLWYAVMIVTAIFYYYQPEWLLIWMAAAYVLIGVLFRILRICERQSLLGMTAYLGFSFVIFWLALVCVRSGRDGWLAPEDATLQLDFMVWFLTPQSVLDTVFQGYIFALFLLFCWFIGSIVCFYSFYIYRVLMSFVCMSFPFVIYAKEGETMPIPFILILLVMYFAVMIYCRQMRAEDKAVVQVMQSGEAFCISKAPSKSRFHSDLMPEWLDMRCMSASCIFLAAAAILAMIVPKPTVQADRRVLDTLLASSSISDMLMGAISNFTESSDGGTYTSNNTSALYYAQADTAVNLKSRSFSYYDLESDSWRVGSCDQPYGENALSYIAEEMQTDDAAVLREVSPWLLPHQQAQLLQKAVQMDAEFGKTYGLSGLAEMDVSDASIAPYRQEIRLQNLNAGGMTYPAASNVLTYESRNPMVYSNWENRVDAGLFRTASGVIYRYSPEQIRGEYSVQTYLSDRYFRSEPMQLIVNAFSAQTAGMTDAEREDWMDQFWNTLFEVLSEESLSKEMLKHLFSLAYMQNTAQEYYRESGLSPIPDSVRQLAETVTAGKTTDFEKAEAIRQYLSVSGEFTYSLEFEKDEEDNVESFLFENKQGVCYQFATAMTLMCQAVGIPARYAEGYSMSEQRQSGDFIIRASHAHAFTEIYILGYGWLSMDATAPSNAPVENDGAVLGMIQLIGLILLAVVLLALVLVVWVVPMVREQLFLRWYRKRYDAKAVQAGFARLRKQWHADPVKTARMLGVEMEAFLDIPVQPAVEIFEQAFYGNVCTQAQAMQFLQHYLAIRDAWKPAQKRERRRRRELAKQTRHKTAAAG